MAMKVHKQLSDLTPGDRFLLNNLQYLVTDKSTLCVAVYTGKLKVIPLTTIVQQV